MRRRLRARLFDGYRKRKANQRIKNAQFANTPGGAQGSAVIYSIIETAKENGLDPFRYLTHILSTAPALVLSDPDWAESLTPEFAPASCRSLQPRAQS